MIWFNIKLNAPMILDDSQELTNKVRELLGTVDALYTGSHEFNELGLTLEDTVWEHYEKWETDLLTKGQEKNSYKLTNHELLVFKTHEDETVIQIKGHDLPAWYVKNIATNLREL